MQLLEGGAAPQVNLMTSDFLGTVGKGIRFAHVFFFVSGTEASTAWKLAAIAFTRDRALTPILFCHVISIPSACGTHSCDRVWGRRIHKPFVDVSFFAFVVDGALEGQRRRSSF